MKTESTAFADLVVTAFEPGDEVDAMSTAGDPFTRYAAFGIAADVFDGPNGEAWIPTIQSERQGSGKLDGFLFVLQRALGAREIVFVNVINMGLECHLAGLGIRCVEPEEAWPSSPSASAETAQ